VAARRLAAALALLATLALPGASGCTYSTVREGDDRFLRSELDWQPGSTTLNEVLSSLGPPDVMRRAGDELVFVYRFRREVRTGLLISFYLNLLTRARQERTDTTLVVTFDRRDVLVSRAYDVGPGSE
jgi:hypothetical protein